MKRENVLEKIIEEQQKIINSLQQSVDRYRTASDIDEDSTMDPEDLSHQTEAKDMQLRFEKMLKNAKDDLNFIINEKNTNHNVIEEGSVINIGTKILFVGVSVPRFLYEEKEIVCFSLDTPVFQKNKGKKVSDHVELGAETFVIKEIN